MFQHVSFEELTYSPFKPLRIGELRNPELYRVKWQFVLFGAKSMNRFSTFALQLMNKSINIFEKRFFAAWIFSAVTMYGISYLWHGVFLNDFQKVAYPKDVLLISFALIYSVLGLVLSLFVKFLYFQSSTLMRGLLGGIALGFFVYLIAFSLGISLYSTPQWQYIAFDLTWQMVEQGVGGMVAALVYSMVTAMTRNSAF